MKAVLRKVSWWEVLRSSFSSSQAQERAESELSLFQTLVDLLTTLLRDPLFLFLCRNMELQLLFLGLSPLVWPNRTGA